jgi:hypothetical protein
MPLELPRETERTRALPIPRGYSRPSRAARPTVGQTTKAVEFGAVDWVGKKPHFLVRLKTGSREYRRLIQRFVAETGVVLDCLERPAEWMGLKPAEVLARPGNEWGHATWFEAIGPVDLLQRLNNARWCVESKLSLPTRVTHSFGSGPEKMHPTGPARRFIKPELSLVCPAEAPPSDDVDMDAPDSPSVEPFKLPTAPITYFTDGTHNCPAAL